MTLNGKAMENGRQFRVNLYRHAVGETVDLQVLRGTQKLTFRVPISESTTDPNRFADMVRPEDNLIQELGILVIELDQRVMMLLPGLRTRTGVVVAARSVETPMIETLGLLPGDVIFGINKTSDREYRQSPRSSGDSPARRHRGFPNRTQHAAHVCAGRSATVRQQGA